MRHISDAMKEELEQWLREDGQLGAGPAILEPLAGGVSSDIYKVDQGGRAFIAKRALSRLRVCDEWHADITRNATEYRFFRVMRGILGDSLPQVFFHNEERGYFTMEYLGGRWENWKARLLRGDLEPEHGVIAGRLLGRLHAASWGEESLAQMFETTGSFRQLRTDPYLRTTAVRHPEWAELLNRWAEELEETKLCLVHGDFSPKNLLVDGGRMVLLDAEVAWFGDPAFDVAFLFALLLLKGLHVRAREGAWKQLASAAWEAYRIALGGHSESSHFDARCTRLTVAVLLARIDGKSPADYLSVAEREMTRHFVAMSLKNLPSALSELFDSWEQYLAR